MTDTTGPGPFPWEVPSATPPNLEPDDVATSVTPASYDPDVEASAIDEPLSVDESVASDVDDVSVEEISDDTSAAVELSSAVLDANRVDRLLDDLVGDKVRRLTVQGMRETMIDRVRHRSDTRRRLRVDRLGADPTTPSDVRLEIIGAADDAEILLALGSAFVDAGNEAKGIAGEILDELPGRGGKPRQSTKVADGHGWEVSLKREPRRELVVDVDVDAVVGVLVPFLVGKVDPGDADADKGDADAARHYTRGVREGVDLFRSVLATSPTFRSTALDSLVTKLESAGEDALATRLRGAYRRVDKGDPVVKITRAPLEGEA